MCSGYNRSDIERSYLKKLLLSENEDIVLLLGEPNTLTHWKFFQKVWNDSPESMSWSFLKKCLLASSNKIERLDRLHGLIFEYEYPQEKWLSRQPSNIQAEVIQFAMAARMAQSNDSSYASQCIAQQYLLRLSIVAAQGFIWNEQPLLYSYPMPPREASRIMNETACQDRGVYEAMRYYQNQETTPVGWKRRCIKEKEFHNLEKLSSTPFFWTEYCLEQQIAENDTLKMSAVVLDVSDYFLEQKDAVDPVDVWMFTQLLAPSSSWSTSNCPLPNEIFLQQWWYALLLEAPATTLLQLLNSSLTSTPPETTFSLPCGTFV